MMKAAVCFDGVDDETLVDTAQPFLRHFERIEAWCGYGEDAQRLLHEVAVRHHAPPPPPPPHHEAIDAEQAQAIAAHGAVLLRQAGFDAVARALGGRDPGHALAQASSSETLLLLGTGHRAGVGPKSVGHVARFVIDHARGPLLLLRISNEDLRSVDAALTR